MDSTTDSYNVLIGDSVGVKCCQVLWKVQVVLGVCRGSRDKLFIVCSTPNRLKRLLTSASRVSST